MNSNYKQVSGNTIIESNYPDGKERYFSRVTSKPDIDRMFEDDEAEYGILTKDIMIERQNGNVTSGIIISFERDGEQGGSWFDLIISEVAGFFVSDWY